MLREPPAMHVSLIGSGAVGTSLAGGLDAAGHEVVVGSRTPSETALDDANVDVVGQAEAVDGVDATILAVPSDTAVALAEDFAGELRGTAVIDPTNEYPEPTAEASVAERIAEAAPAASVAKAFNSIGAEHLADPTVGAGTATMFIAGAAPAREIAGDLAEDLGFDVVVVGNLDAAGHLENLGRLWIDLSLANGRDVAYHLLRT